MAESAGVHTERLRLGYGDREVVAGLSTRIPAGQITVIVGPNACGKSTFLRGVARLLRPSSGAAYLDGKSIHAMPSKDVAKKLGILPQSPSAPDGITVVDLVGRGRSPHQGWFDRWSAVDDEAVASAMTATGTLDLADRQVDELSGGQRQRVWIAMALAQRTGVLLLDEPTTFLDVTHQVEVLDLLVDLNRTQRSTIVLVLHDLNLACRYADNLMVFSAGELVAEGAPREVVSEDLVREVFALSCRVVPDPVADTPMIVPIGRHDPQPQRGPDAHDVSSEEELRSVVPEPAPAIRNKAVAGIDEQTKRFLREARFFLLATANTDGSMDVSPRGDVAGGLWFAEDGRALAFADRAGNRRLDSMRNILRQPRVGMLFLVPGVGHTVRVNGRARITRDPTLLEHLATSEHRPVLATVIDVDEVYVHCGQAFARSALWEPESWPDRTGLPNPGELFKAQAALRDGQS
ncbi:iron complex transport system ATP-binding protein [Tamaricihabitans halophyticus]|uniref:Iron complex transport system ATP-binding protein n=2 Tax=Tamaricihabitans halophyticus TaxID=1262583 RepID=A0A4R2QI59_9PSEU|nr:iron complex transport system ATP-binding protein [Tamaricihabitans halophyticus]